MNTSNEANGYLAIFILFWKKWDINDSNKQCVKKS